MEKNQPHIERAIKKFLEGLGKDYDSYTQIGILELSALSIQSLPSEFNQCRFLNKLVVIDCNQLEEIYLNNPNLYCVMIISNRGLQKVEIGGGSCIEKFVSYSNNPGGVEYIVEDSWAWRNLFSLEVDRYDDFLNLGIPESMELDSVHFINETYDNLVNIHRVRSKNIDITFDRGERSNYIYVPNYENVHLIKKEFGDFFVGDSCINFWIHEEGIKYKKIFEIFKK